jgi:hypothetical protein
MNEGEELMSRKRRLLKLIERKMPRKLRNGNLVVCPF